MLIHDLLRREIETVGAENVFLGGLGQGCAAGLIALMMRKGREPLGGFVGMCEWLPLARLFFFFIIAGCESPGDEHEKGDKDVCVALAGQAGVGGHDTAKEKFASEGACGALAFLRESLDILDKFGPEPSSL